MLYVLDPAHPLLSAAALALAAEELEAHVYVAHGVFDLLGTEYTEDDELALVYAGLARQVNAQVAAGVDALLLQSETRGRRAKTWRTDGNGNLLVVDPLAALIFWNLRKRLGYGAARSVRGRAAPFDGLALLDRVY